MIPSALFVFTSLLGVAAEPSGVVTERVFGKEIPTGNYKHPASITELDNGDLYLAYYGGSGEYKDDSTVYGARKKKGESKWSMPQAIKPRPKDPEGNAVIWQAPDGIVWLFSLTRHGNTWSDSRITARISTDGAHTWHKPYYLTKEPGTMVRGKPIVLRNGDYLLPIYHETGHDQEFVAPDTMSFFLRYDVKNKKWSETGRIKSKRGNLQPAVAQLSDNFLICYCRRAGGYGQGTSGHIIRADSHDGGQTWSEGKDTAFPNPNSAVDSVRLANGHLVLVYNDDPRRRSPLTVAISTDEDRTYPYRRNIAEGRNEFAYPYAIQTRDGKIHVIYTKDKRTVIMHAVFDESAILKK